MPGWMFFGFLFDFLPGMGLSTARMLTFLIIALWWFRMTVPLLRNYQQKHYAQEGGHVVKDSKVRLGKTFAQARSKKHIFQLKVPQYSQKVLNAMSEAKQISRDPDVPGYTSMDGLKKVLEK